MDWRELRPGTYVTDSLPNCSIYRLRYGGWRYQIGGHESPTYGQVEAALRDLLEAAQNTSHMGKH